MKKLIVLGITLMAIVNIYGQSYYSKSTETILEEKFVYGVSWAFFHLGTLTLTVESVIADPELKKITVDIKTASLLPFIDIDEYNEVIMRMRDGMTMNFYGTEELDGEKVEKHCNYYEDENLSVYEERNLESAELISRDTVTYSKPYLIGSSLIHYTRLIADSGLVINVPTMLGGDIYNTKLNFCGPVEYIEIDEFDEPIRTFKYEGSAEWDGKATAGLSGDFTGWLSDDDASVVIRAEMKILLGSVVIELEEWYKPGWTPPTKIKLLTNN
jgi:hypothetical protein